MFGLQIKTSRLPLQMPLVCDIEVKPLLSVRLTVSPSTPDAWIWTFILHSGNIVASGKTDTRLAAQVASQRAHEYWLHKNRKQFNIPIRVSYNWKEAE